MKLLSKIKNIIKNKKEEFKNGGVRINKKFFTHYEGVTIKQEAFLLFLQLGFLGIVISTIRAILSNQSKGAIIANFLIIAICVIEILVCRDTRRIPKAQLILLGSLGVIVFPIMYFLSGPYNAMIYWDILLITVSSLCLENKYRKPVVITQIVAMIATMHIGKYYPQFFSEARTGDKIYIAVIVAFISVSIIIAVVSSFILTSIDKLVKELEESNKRAKKSEKAKTQFLAAMSHEIRTPINAIIGLNQMNLDSDDLETVKMQCNDIKHSSEVLLGIINDILDYSKIEEGKFNIIREPYSPKKIIKELKTLEHRANSKDISFSIIENEATPLPDGLYGDSKRIMQIGFNVINNAIKYTDEGGVTVRVGWIPYTNQFVEANMEGHNFDGYLKFTVQDTGKGIKKEDVPHLFEAFERVDEQLNNHIEGTGLGLAIVKNLLNLMNGIITVHSEYGVGSTFIFSIPQKLSDYKEAEQTDIIPDFSDKQILCVDDNALNLKVFGGLLKKTGCVPTLLNSGKKCIEYLREEAPDIIFMDIMMPEMSGEECFKKIRQMGIQVPVIALTADAVDNAKDRYMDMGFSGYLSKPIDRYRLWEIIKEK